MNRTRSRPVRKPAHDSVKASCPSGLNQILANPAYTADSKMFMGWTKVGYRTNALAWFSQYRQSPLFWGGIHGILDCWPTYRMRLPEGGIACFGDVFMVAGGPCSKNQDGRMSMQWATCPFLHIFTTFFFSSLETFSFLDI